MTVVALAAFVVKSENARSVNDIGQPVVTGAKGRAEKLEDFRMVAKAVGS